MRTLFRKTLGLAGLLFLGGCIFFLGQFPLNEGKHLLDPYIDTQFSKNFSFEKFHSITIGMKMNEVEEILGLPIYTYGRDSLSLDNTITYNYTSDGKQYLRSLKEGKTYGDFAWYSAAIKFDSSNVVIAIYNGWMQD